MSHKRTSRSRTLLRRLLRAQLRLKVMAGVVVVTLVALVAFDVSAVTIMRRYLLVQTDDSLRVAMTLTAPRLNAMLYARAHDPGTHQVPSEVRAINSKYPALPGAFDMAFLPLHGAQVTLQVAANGSSRNFSWTLSPRAARVVNTPGAHTLSGVGGGQQLRVSTLRLDSGSLIAGTSLDQVSKTINQVKIIVMFGSIAVVLLIGLGVFFVLRRGLRPIESMARQADRITTGDLTDQVSLHSVSPHRVSLHRVSLHRVSLHSPRSEVGRLGAALNGMLARIEADVLERENTQQQMRRFFADASHELRTPLASVRANAELYQQGALSSTDEVDEVMDRIVLETRRMGRLVDDMLRLARIGQHPGQSRQQVDVTDVIAGCAERVRFADSLRTWRVRIAGGLTTVGDEELLRRAVDNLLMNVLVHTPRDTVGTIDAATDGDRLTIDISDDGPGVPPGKLPHIFERFYRAGARPSCPGSGLGLAIAAEVAAAHGGTARAAPVSPHGLRITLTLPVREPSLPARELVASLA